MVDFTEEFVEMVRCLGLAEAEAEMLLFALDRASSEPGCTLDAALRGWWTDLARSARQSHMAAG